MSNASVAEFLSCIHEASFPCVGAKSAAAQGNLQNFDAGLEVVLRHGILTPTGQALMQSARAYADEAR